MMESKEKPPDLLMQGLKWMVKKLFGSVEALSDIKGEDIGEDTADDSNVGGDIICEEIVDDSDAGEENFDDSDAKRGDVFC